MGTILYEMLTGIPAVEGDSLVNTIYNIVHKEVVPLRKHKPYLDSILESICMKALEKNPEKRYSSAQAFAEDVERFCKREKVSLQETAPKKRHWAYVALILLLSLSMGGLAWYFMKMRDVTPALSLEEQEKLKQKAEEYYNLAIDFHQNQKWVEAIENYSHTIKNNPQHANAYIGRGGAYFAQREMAKAIADFSESLKIAPDNTRAYHDRALAYFELEELDKCIADNTKAVEIDPKFMDGYNNRGLARRRKGDFQSAILDITYAITLSPETYELYSNRAAVYIAQNDYERAILDYTKVIELKPDYTPAYYYRGACLMETGQREEAEKDFQQFLSLAPDDPLASSARERLRKLTEKK